MKAIIFLFILTQSILLSQMEYETHYNSIGNNLKFFKLSESKVLLYGDNGVILRSKDAGENWEQNFTGTHSYILKLIKKDGFIIGINNNYEYMYSEDGGDYWKYKKTQYDFKDICTLNENVIISTYSNKLYFTDIYGTNFVEKETPVDSIFYVFSKNENLFIVNRKFQIYRSDDLGENWKEFKLNTVMGQFRYKEINNNLYLYGTNEIIKINDDLSLSNYVIGIKKGFEFYEYNDGFIVLNSSLTTLTITKYFYNINEDKLVTLGVNNSLRISPDNHSLIDIIVINDVLYNSHYVKTILKSAVLSNEYEIVTYMPFVPTDIKLINDKELILLDDGRKVQSLFSNDGGKFFKLNENYLIDTLLNDKAIDFDINDIYYKATDEWFLLLRQNSSVEDFSLFYYTKDRGKTFDSVPSVYDFKTRFIDYDNEMIYFQSEKSVVTSININELNLNTNEINIINKLENTSRAFFHKLDNNEFLILTTYENQNGENNNVKLLKTNDNFKTINLIEEKKIDKDMLGAFYRFNPNLFFFYTFNLTNLKSNFYKIASDELTMLDFNDTTLITLAYDGYSDIHYNFMENETLTQTSSTVTGNPANGGFSYRVKSNYVKLKYEGDKFNVETIGEAVSVCKEYFSEDGLTKFYYAPRHLFIPIEPERLEYYTSVVEKSTTSIWTYPPYPNPVKDKLKMKFYVNNSADLSKLKIELINISNGKLYHLNDYKLSLLDDSMGELEVDIKAYIPGAYLINFKLDNTNKSESIIIE